MAMRYAEKVLNRREKIQGKHTGKRVVSCQDNMENSADNTPDTQ